MHYKRIIRVPIRKLSYRKVLNWYAGLVKPVPQKAPYRHIVQIGDPVLRQQASRVPIHDIPSPQIQKVLQQMRHVFIAYNCIGLSAPQIGVPLQILMIQLSDKVLKSYTDEEIKSRNIIALPLMVVINPEMKILDYTKVTFSEVCGSIRGFGADVPRYNSVVLKGYASTGKSVELIGKGWTARIIQHEMDHLSGRLYTDIMDRKTFACTCWDVVNAYNGKVQIPLGPD